MFVSVTTHRGSMICLLDETKAFGHLGSEHCWGFFLLVYKIDSYVPTYLKNISSEAVIHSLACDSGLFESLLHH
jgi:hypothetical protein